jgi:hypothetical protein
VSAWNERSGIGSATGAAAPGAAARAAEVLAAVRHDPALLSRFVSLHPGTLDALSALHWVATGEGRAVFERREEVQRDQAVAYGRHATETDRRAARARLSALERDIAADRDAVSRAVDAFLLTRDPPSEDGGGRSGGDDPVGDAGPLRRRFPRAPVAGVLAAALLAALALPALRPGQQGDSMAVFDRAQTAEDRGDPSLFRHLLVANDLIDRTEAAWVEAQQDIRLLGSSRGVSVYAGQVPGGLICVATVRDAAAASGTCVTEHAFRDRGVQVDSYELPDPDDPGLQGVIHFSWGPQGGLTAEYALRAVTSDA